MNLSLLNPYIRSVELYEKPVRTGEVMAYDARVLFVVSGGLTLEADGKKQKLSPGNFVFLPPALPYSLKCDYAKFVLLTFDLVATADAPEARLVPATKETFKPALVRGAEDAAPFDRMILIADMMAERDTFLDLHRIAMSAAGAYRARISAKLKTILLRAAEESDENALPSRMIESLDAYIRENAGDDLSNTEIGAVFGYHPFYVSQMLKKKLGTTLKQYIISYRLRYAADLLLHTKKTVNEISEETGFNDSSYFTKSFKSVFGVTPKEYRNKAENESI